MFFEFKIWISNFIAPTEYFLINRIFIVNIYINNSNIYDLRVPFWIAILLSRERWHYVACLTLFQRFKSIDRFSPFAMHAFSMFVHRWKYAASSTLKLHLAYLPNFFPFESEYWIIINMLKLNNFPKKTSNKIIFLPLFC